MKVSKDEQLKTRRRLVQAAVEVMSHHGFRNATMREIAQRARVGDATIYKYFPTKESLLFGFFELRMDDLIQRLKGVPDFHQYRFQEQLHVLLETQLDLFAADRAFIRIAYEGVFLTHWITAATGSQTTKERFFAIVDDLVAAAVEAGEFEEPPFKKLLYELLWEYTIGITYYWLEDSSPKYVNTTQMLDKSLAVLHALLASNVSSKLIDLVQFFVREHVLAKIQDMKKERRPEGRRPKRRFMADNEPQPQRTRTRKR